MLLPPKKTSPLAAKLFAGAAALLLPALAAPGQIPLRKAVELTLGGAAVGMALLCPNVGEVVLLTDLLGNGQNWTLKLYKTNVTPSETDTAASYTVADFTNYANKTLTRTVSGTTWQTPTTSSGTTSSSYNPGTPQTWTCGASGNTVYGYYVVGASDTILQFAELFATARVLANTDVLNLTPVLQLD